MSWLSDVTGVNIDVAGALAHFRDSANSIIQGGNVFDNLKKIGDETLGLTMHILDPLAGNAGFNNILNNPFLNTITFGIAGNEASFGNVAADLQNGVSTNNLQTKDVQGTIQLIVKVGAIATGAAILAAPASIAEAAQLYAAAGAINKAATSGNFLGAAVGATAAVAGADDSGTLSTIADTAGIAAHLLPNGGSSKGPAQQTRNPSRNISSDVQQIVGQNEIAQSSNSPSKVPLYLGIAFVTLLILKKAA